MWNVADRPSRAIPLSERPLLFSHPEARARHGPPRAAPLTVSHVPPRDATAPTRSRSDLGARGWPWLESEDERGVESPAIGDLVRPPEAELCDAAAVSHHQPDLFSSGSSFLESRSVSTATLRDYYKRAKDFQRWATTRYVQPFLLPTLMEGHHFLWASGKHRYRSC